jgi:1-acyl-sn-glycerol-3-phosphate acyltransferase
MMTNEASSKSQAGVRSQKSGIFNPQSAIQIPQSEDLGLTKFERFAFRFVARMNCGRIKDFWTFCQRTIGAGWIRLATYNLLEVYGLANIERVSHERPLLLVANHRSYFDMYVVSAVLFMRTKWKKRLFFPVRAKFFYTTPLGLFVNFVMGWWSMFPPFFYAPEKRAFDKRSLEILINLCRAGAGNIIGFHPEGKRNLNSDPYTFLPAQPGIGKIIKESKPQVIPVFIAGLGNNLPKQILSNWRGGEKIRLHFGAPIDLNDFYAKPDTLRTQKQIADFVMCKVAELGERDRQSCGLFKKENETVGS